MLLGKRCVVRVQSFCQQQPSSTTQLYSWYLYPSLCLLVVYHLCGIQWKESGKYFRWVLLWIITATDGETCCSNCVVLIRLVILFPCLKHVIVDHSIILKNLLIFVVSSLYTCHSLKKCTSRQIVSCLIMTSEWHYIDLKEIHISFCTEFLT